MTDLLKTVVELRLLAEKASPGPWALFVPQTDANSALIFAMRNNLDDLLQAAEETEAWRSQCHAEATKNMRLLCDLGQLENQLKTARTEVARLRDPIERLVELGRQVPSGPDEEPTDEEWGALREEVERLRGNIAFLSDLIEKAIKEVHP